MDKAVYIFREFRLDPLARELARNGNAIPLPSSAFDCLVYLIEHRQRAVCRDELLAAVWERVDASDSLLAHTIVRLRRALGDTGSEQHSIRTIPRVGYRWVAETLVQTPTADTTATASDDGASATEDAAVTAIPKAASDITASRHRLPWLVAGSVLLLLSAVIVWRPWRRATPGHATARPGAVVLPAQVQASAEWAWLHLGLMDLISNRLRRAKLDTIPSGTVVAMLKQQAGHTGSDLLASPALGASWRITPMVKHDADGLWHVRLILSRRHGGPQSSHAEAHDVIVAARQATDLLLVKLGQRPPATGSEEQSPDLQRILQQITAARLAGQIKLASQLAEQTPAKWHDAPDIVLERARLQCDIGNTGACRHGLLALLQRLPENSYRLRGRAFDVLGMLAGNRGRIGPALSYLDQAVEASKRAHDTRWLANAYSDRGWLQLNQLNLQAAVADIDRARATFMMNDDVVGVARSDYNMALVEAQQGHPRAALSLARQTYDRFKALGLRLMLPSTLDLITSLQKPLLQFRDELASTDQFWPLDAHDIQGSGLRRELTLSRAIALADNGRLADAEALARSLLDQAAMHEAPAFTAEVTELRAQLAFQRGDADTTTTLASKAMTPALLAADRREYANTWLLRIRALLRNDKIAAATAQTRQLQSWAVKGPHSDRWSRICAELARAELAKAQQNTRAALQHFATALDQAQRFGVPELQVRVGTPYALTLIDAGHLDRAAVVAGSLSHWADSDMRAAWVQARLYRALGDTRSWQRAAAKARKLAGERRLPGPLSGKSG